jgi:hypothetical protein
MMRSTLLRFLPLAALACLPLAVWAQASPQRVPYPLTYGLGLTNLNQNFGSIRSLGLNGIGMALADESFINDYNIALLPYSSQNLLIDADLSFWTQGRTYFDRRKPDNAVSRSAPLSKFRVPGVRVAYPLLSGTLVLRAAYQPVLPYEFTTIESSFHRSLSNVVPAPPPDTLTRIASGAARLRQYSLGAGFTMLPNVTGGIQVDYLTGTFSAASSTRDRVDTTAKWTDAGRVRSWRLTGAISQRMRLTQTLTLRSGFSATYSLPLSTAGAPSVEGNGGGGGLARVTTRIPLLLRGGLSVSNDRTWRLGLDASWQRWNKYRTWSGLAQYTNSLSLGAAGEYTPGGPNAEQYVRRITYRAGVRFDNKPVEELNRPVSEISIGAGASLPVTSVLETRRSYINVGLRVGRASYPETDVYRATTFEIGVGFTFNSRLYIPIGRGNCPIPSCHVRKKHMHDGVEFRGQPWYKMQNPHIGEKLPYRKPTEKPKTNEKARFKF